jgi:alpha-1,3-rhamnosyl/mannosyltransferase
MRIVFNLLPTLKPKTGVGHYAARLFAALHHLPHSNDLHGFPGGRLATVVRRLHAARPAGGPEVDHQAPPFAGTRAAVNQALQSAGRGCLAVAFRSACRRHRFDLYHEPNFIPFACDVPAVVTVHDLSVVLHPEWHPADRVRHHEARFRRGLAAAHSVITVSQFIRRQVIDYLGIGPERVTAVPNGVGPEYFAVTPQAAARTRRALGLPEDYLLSVGTIEPRKNVLTVLQAYCSLPASLRARCPLVVAGGWGWRSADVAEFLRRHAAAKHVIPLGYTDDRHLPGLYAGARALAYPSFYEGFGLPPLEMLACGGAVIASTAAAHREVLAGHAHFVEPLDHDGWRHAFARAIRDNDWLADLRRGGTERARQFSWERTAAETAAAYLATPSAPRRAA